MWLGTAALPSSADAAESTLRIVLGQELRIIDPVFSPSYAPRDHGFLIYDQLFGLNSRGEPVPEMVESYTVSEDKLTYSFTLRDGLVFSDGAPVRAADATASIERWMRRDTVGNAMIAAGGKLEAVDDRTFRLRLSTPFSAVLSGFAKSSSIPLFVMPERVAKTDPNQQLTDTTGSGPFIFKRDEWRPGNKAVYVRNPNYRPRPEPPDGLAGGKTAKVDRIEWLSMPDANTAISALQAGEVDFVEEPPLDLVADLESDPNVKLLEMNPVGLMFLLRTNNLLPPFDDVKMRRALIPAIDQLSVVQATGTPKGEYYTYCPAMFMCGTKLESRAGAPESGKPDYAKAKALLAEAGYKGEKILFMQPTDDTLINLASSAVIASLRNAGLNVEVAAMDWATLSMRRNKKEPPDRGGWNAFVTVMSPPAAENPLTNLYMATPCPNAIYGWPCDAEIEKLRAEWARTADAVKAKAIVEDIQRRAYEVVPYLPVGQIRPRVAYRAELKGLRATNVPVFWNVER